MGVTTGISWTSATWNPWLGCQRWSPGCGGPKGEGGCYAEALVVGRMGLKVWGPPSTTPRHRTAPGNWKLPARLNRKAIRDGARRKLFVASLCDIFEDHPALVPWRAEALALLASCTALDVQLLTKRPENICAMVPPAWLGAWPKHIWMGTTVEDQRRADERIPHLLDVPARVRFLSMEPLLERVDLSDWLFVEGEAGWCGDCGDGRRAIIREGYDECAVCGARGDTYGHALSWVIVGGESGPDARPFDLAWARSILGQCREAGVAAFVKQLGDTPVEVIEECPTGGGCDECAAVCRYKRAVARSIMLRAHHGADPSEWPEDLRVQEFPR